MNELCLHCSYRTELKEDKSHFYCKARHCKIPFNMWNCKLYKKKLLMKDLLKSWKFWVALAAVVLVIVCIVLFFTVPEFAQVTGGALIGLIVGAILCYLFMMKKASK